nr:DUF1365 domain-containing protein [Mesorhizobium sp. B2-3-12]
MTWKIVPGIHWEALKLCQGRALSFEPACCRTRKLPGPSNGV